MFRKSISVALGLSLLGAAHLSSPTPASAASLLQDGTFQTPIGVGLSGQYWDDWTGAGITEHAAPAGVPGNYASIPYFGDLFQRFTGPVPGTYDLSFYVQNQSPWSAELVFAVQKPLGESWNETLQVLPLAQSAGWTRENFTFTVSQPTGTPSEFYFSNSYDDPNYPGLQGTRNPLGTVINVADVSISAVPEPSTWALMVAGFAAVGLLARRGRRTQAVA